MTKFIIGTILLVCAAVCAGYFHYRKKPVNLLKLRDILNWIDEILPQIPKEEGVKLEVNILPNKESQDLLKHSDKYAYVAILQKIENDKNVVLRTKVFRAKSVDIDLESLKSGNIVVIPIE